MAREPGVLEGSARWRNVLKLGFRYKAACDDGLWANDSLCTTNSMAAQKTNLSVCCFRIWGWLPWPAAY